MAAGGSEVGADLAQTTVRDEIEIGAARHANPGGTAKRLAPGAPATPLPPTVARTAAGSSDAITSGTVALTITASHAPGPVRDCVLSGRAFAADRIPHGCRFHPWPQSSQNSRFWSADASKPQLAGSVHIGRILCAASPAPTTLCYLRLSTTAVGSSVPRLGGWGSSWSKPVVISGSLDQAFVSVPVVAADGHIYVSFLNTTDLATGRDDYEVVQVSPATGAPVAAPVKVATVIDGATDYPIAFGRQTYQDSVFRTWAAGNIAADPKNPAHLAVVWSDMRDSATPAPPTRTRPRRTPT
jgi:hypothetical protein